ncbi:DUF932 domain-containing protein [Pedobacter xixiisoli]|uniref:Phage/plasmid-like protein TIGR03299 n=1 Tax=Pedobacter xixiisoli TaxID=1476464 RepID=A0A286A788_9SPHI|nr:DUF932 domain-containing protein [Pedobacter xixiisoli]SOD17759.1 phage/plasmid-like protein TIGR03299 [Pedobacter xixiisoli]
MGHNLSKNSKTGNYSFFSVKEKAWHGLGQVVQHYPTSAEAIRLAGLDYEVGKLPNTHILPSGNSILSDSSFYTYRADTEEILGSSVGRDYQIVQNSEAFAFFDAIVGGGEGIMYETAGALGNGGRIFITAKLPDYIRVGNGDDVTEKYIFLTTSHDGSGSITAAFTPIRIVCQNTLNASLRNMSNVVRIRHTSGAKDRLKEVHKVMGIANTLSTQLEGIFNQWATVKITDEQVKKLIQLAMCPNKETLKLIHSGNDEDMSAIFRNTVEDAFAYAMMSDTQQMETTKGTVFGAYNAVTGYFQNVRKFKDDEEKVKNIILGGTAQTKAQKAFDLCTDFAKGGADIFNWS